MGPAPHLSPSHPGDSDVPDADAAISYDGEKQAQNLNALDSIPVLSRINCVI